jgi:Protein of unknown function (DUF3363)
VRAALAERETFLGIKQLAERRGQRAILVRDLLSRLSARGLESAVGRIAAETGLIDHPVIDGQPVSGIFRRSVVLGSGRFAMLDGGMRFTLVPWRSVIEAHLGQAVTAVTRGGQVSWKLSRQRGMLR